MVTFFLTVVYAAHAFIQMKQIFNNKGRMIVCLKLSHITFY